MLTRRGRAAAAAARRISTARRCCRLLRSLKRCASITGSRPRQPAARAEPCEWQFTAPGPPRCAVLCRRDIVCEAALPARVIARAWQTAGIMLCSVVNLALWSRSRSTRSCCNCLHSGCTGWHGIHLAAQQQGQAVILCRALCVLHRSPSHESGTRAGSHLKAWWRDTNERAQPDRWGHRSGREVAQPVEARNGRLAPLQRRSIVAGARPVRGESCRGAQCLDGVV